MITIPPDGVSPDRPTLLGEPNGDAPVQVYSTGMFKSLRKGETRWVTGTAVAAGIDSGVLTEIGLDPLDSPIRIVEPTVITPVVAPADYAEPTGDVPTATDADVKLADMSKSQLVKLARELDIEGRSAMDKSELYEHLRHHPQVADHLH